MFDQDTLFFAAGICAAALALTILNVWLHSRAERFLVGWGMGMVLLACGVILYATQPPDHMPLVAVAFGLEIVGFTVIFFAARDFIGRPSPPVAGLLAGLGAALIVSGPILAGYDGIGLTVYNVAAGILVALTAAQYWHARHEAPAQVFAMMALYGLTALSFFACTAMLLRDQRWVLHARPDNWAENLNAIMCIAGITGIGALSLGLKHARVARRHREEARTDALTGLLNRRALFDGLQEGALHDGDAVIQFDLDRFKGINDRHGHAMGDAVLKSFADAVRRNIGDADLAARIGGEEFVLLLRHSTPARAHETAERIRADLNASKFGRAGDHFRATASAGIAMVHPEDVGFAEVLHRADVALYRAKNGGRNRVATELQAVA